MISAIYGLSNLASRRGAFGILHLEPRGHRPLTQLFVLYVSEDYSTDFVSTEISDLSGTGLHLNGSSASSLGGILSGYRLIALLHSITAALNSVKRSEWTHIILTSVGPPLPGYYTIHQYTVY